MPHIGMEISVHDGAQGRLRGQIVLYTYGSDDVSEGGNVADLVERDGGLPIHEIELEDRDGSLLGRLLLEAVKGLKIELVCRRFRREGWHLKPADDD